MCKIHLATFYYHFNFIHCTFRNGPYLFSCLYIETYKYSSGTLNDTTIPVIMFTKHRKFLRLSQLPAKEKSAQKNSKYHIYANNQIVGMVVVYENISLPSPDSDRHNMRFNIPDLDTWSPTKFPVRDLDSARYTRSLQP